MMTPEQRRERAKIAANERWARPGARAKQSAAAAKVMRRRLERQVDPDMLMAPQEREAAIAAAARAMSARMTLRRSRA